MAKTKVTTRKFTIIDLVRYKPSNPDIIVDPTRIDITIDVTTKGILSASTVPSAALDRLEKAARDALDVYETTITDEIKRFEKKFENLKKVGDLEEIEKQLPTLNHAIKNALASAEGAALAAVEKRLVKEAKDDSNLKEAQVKLAFKVVVGLISVSKNIATLVASAGADIKAYIDIAKTVYKVGKELYDYNKGEAKLREALEKALKAYLKLRATRMSQGVEKLLGATDGFDFTSPKKSFVLFVSRVKDAGETVLKGRTASEVATDLRKFVVASVKADMNKMEDCRVAYREHVTKTRHKVDDTSAQADKLMKAMKSGTSLKDGVAIGAKYMSIKRSVTAMAGKLEDREKVLLDFEGIMMDMGLEVDDTPFLQKLKQLDPTSIADLCTAVQDFAGEIKDLIEAVT
jgi:hypothetical protein